MFKHLCSALILLVLTPLCWAQGYEQNPDIFQKNWHSFPLDNNTFQLTTKSLKQNWQYFHRATQYPFPDAHYVAGLLRQNPKLKEAMPRYRSINQLTGTLQKAWIAFFEGRFQKAAELGYSLGPIGHGVAFYAQVTYASRLEPDIERRHVLWNDVLERHEKYNELTQHDVMTRFFAFFAMARLSEEIAAPLVLTRGYIGTMQKELQELSALDPNNIFALAARGSMDAGIVRKLGKLMGRLTYGASEEIVEEYYDKAIKQNKVIPNVQLEYAQSLLYMYGKKELPRALKHMRIASQVTPKYAMEAMDVFHAKKLLKELNVIEQNKGYGLRDYVKRNTDIKNKYYF